MEQKLPNLAVHQLRHKHVMHDTLNLLEWTIHIHKYHISKIALAIAVAKSSMEVVILRVCSAGWARCTWYGESCESMYTFKNHFNTRMINQSRHSKGSLSRTFAVAIMSVHVVGDTPPHWTLLHTDEY